MKKTWFLNLSIIILMIILSGCSTTKGEDVSLEIWHYYNGAQKLAFDEFVVEFNETLGLEKGIIIEAFSQGNIIQLEERIVNSVEDRVGASDMPNMVAIYPEIAYNLHQRDVLINLENYLTDIEINEYIDSYIEEGRLGKDNELKIFPTAKATEVMMVNKTDWDKFALATGATKKDLSTWEGVKKTGKLYYDWTDSLTEEKNDGKAFFGRDALANYILVGSKQLGKEMFEVKKDKVIVNLDQDIMRSLWDNYYIPYISGYYTSYGRFSTDDAKIGKIVALVGSTTGATYFPENVSIGDSDSYSIELMVLPLPNFENRGLNAVQQGAGIVVLKSDSAHEQAAVEFLKWFTEETRNSEFAMKTGYLPVKKLVNNAEKLRQEFKEEKRQELPKQLQLTLPLAMDQIEEYELHFSEGFEQGCEVRAILDSQLKDKSEVDRKQVLELIDQGMKHEDAIKEFNSDENFNAWFLEFKEKIMEATNNEE